VPAGVPQGLALDRAIQEGEFSAPVGAPRRLEAVFRQGVAFHLHDQPLSAAQVLTALDDERGRLRAPVAPTAELRGWLVGVGALVEVRASGGEGGQVSTAQGVCEGRRAMLTAVVASRAPATLQARGPAILPAPHDRLAGCATRHGSQRAAQARDSHPHRPQPHTAEPRAMRGPHGINGQAAPARWPRGGSLQRRLRARPFTGEALEPWPPVPAARPHPDVLLRRPVMASLAWPPLRHVALRMAVMCRGCAPAPIPEPRQAT
jgi:hypothetical protein